MYRTIFLIGYMGSGKTTLGRAVSAACGIGFIDLDDYIVEREGTSISSLFERGESVFRAAERRALDELLAPQERQLLVACGGGTPCYGDNMELMNASGTTVLLEADYDTLLRRLKLFRAQRPLLKDLSDIELEAFVKESLECRQHHYDKAQSHFDSSRLETEEQITESAHRFIDTFLKQIPPGQK